MNGTITIIAGLLILCFFCGCVPSPEMEAAQWVAPPAAASVSIERGREVFLTGPCAMCHAILGTSAGSRVGPDLTHLATRTMIAAGTLPNTRGHLAGWILNPQNLKPGTKMPPTLLESQDLHSLLAYLETLR